MNKTTRNNNLYSNIRHRQNEVSSDTLYGLGKITALLLLFVLTVHTTGFALAATETVPSGHDSFSKSFALTENRQLKAYTSSFSPRHFYYMELYASGVFTLHFSHDEEERFLLRFYSADKVLLQDIPITGESYTFCPGLLAKGRYYLEVKCQCISNKTDCYHLYYLLNPETPVANTQKNPSTPLPASFPSLPSTKENTLGIKADISDAASVDICPVSNSGQNSGENAISHTDENSMANNFFSDTQDSFPKIIHSYKKTAATGKTKRKAKKIYIRSLSITNKKTVYYVNDTLQLHINVTPENASTTKLRFVSSKPQVAHIDRNGHIRCIHKGKACITAKSCDGSMLYAKITLHVKQAPAKKQTTQSKEISAPDVSSVNDQTKSANTAKQDADNTSSNITSLKFKQSAIVLQTGKKCKLKLTILPQHSSSPKLRWKSMDEQIVSVKNGTITAKKRGITTVVVFSPTDTSVCASCTVTVQ